MQDRNQAPGGNWAWQDARRFYVKALTDPDARAREAAAADMFRALGQVMHLVVDASVPEHTRDDPHPFGDISRLLGRRQAGNYEYWVSDDRQSAFVASLLANPIGFDPSILSLPTPVGESVATVPIARLIDTDRYSYNGNVPPNPNVTLNRAIGLAEFANANFFSEDTLEGRFPFPNRARLTPSPQPAPKGSSVRAYLAKPAGQGLPTKVALAECVTERWIGDKGSPYPCVDEAVWKETATHMLPRAVGYARGVLDYFFRRSVRADFWVHFIEPLNQAGLVLANDSGERMTGTFEIYAGGQAEHRQRASAWYININVNPWEIFPGSTFSLAPGDLALVVLDAPRGMALDHVMVFRGRLGLEEDATASDTFVVP